MIPPINAGPCAREIPVASVRVVESAVNAHLH
jgi:hypothetical protein